MKKGVSPLIASVILVGFTIVLAAFMFFNLSSNTRSLFGTVEDTQKSSRLIDFSVKTSPDMDCDKVNYKIGNGNICYVILVENEMGEEISYIVRTIGDKGVDISQTDKFEPFISKWVAVSYDKDKVGSNVKAELIPVSYE